MRIALASLGVLLEARQSLGLVDDREQIFQAGIVNLPTVLAHAYLRRLVGVHEKFDPGERVITRLHWTEPAADDHLGLQALQFSLELAEPTDGHLQARTDLLDGGPQHLPVSTMLVFCGYQEAHFGRYFRTVLTGTSAHIVGPDEMPVRFTTPPFGSPAAS
jgi:hypothetical protein